MVPDPPETIDLSAGGSIWPAFTISGVTGATGVNGNLFVLAAEAGQRSWRTAAGAECYGAPDDVWTLAATDANEEPAGGSFTGEGTWPWTVATWTPFDGAGGAPAFTRALAPPASINLASGGATVAASLTTALSGANNDLVFTSFPSGRLGNDITVRYVAPGTNNAALAVAVAGRDITVNLATNGSAAVTSTAAQIKTAIEVSTAASALVAVANAAGNNGSGVVTALAATALSGGAGGLPLPPETVAI
jgi:hypothetical protein